MSVIAEFSVPAEEFALGNLLEVRSNVRIRLESMIPAGEVVFPYLWVQSPDVEAVEMVLEESPLVDRFYVVDEVNEETLFRVHWSDDVDGFIETIDRTDAAVLAGEGRGDSWSFQLRFPEYESLSTFYRDLVDKGIPIELGSVQAPIDQSRTSEFGLTREQREALSIALEQGYFAVPREITMVGLAEELGISDSAVSQRLRRGLTKILSTTMADKSSK